MARGRKKHVNTLTDEPEQTSKPEPEETFSPVLPEKVMETGVKVLTKAELYSKITHETQMSEATKAMNVNRFVLLHPGFTFPPNSTLQSKIRYIEYVAHFKLYEEK